MRKILCMVGRADVMNHQGDRKGWCLKFWGKELWKGSVCVWGGGGGRTLLEVRCVKPTEGRN